MHKTNLIKDADEGQTRKFNFGRAFCKRDTEEGANIKKHINYQVLQGVLRNF